MQSDREANVLEKLKSVVDPEIGINIVDLGLIYSVVVEERQATVTMTLTAPNCPFGEVILEETHDTVTEIEGIESVEITLTFNPPWNPDKISDAAKFYMGIL